MGGVDAQAGGADAQALGVVQTHRLEDQMREWEGSLGEKGLGLTGGRPWTQTEHSEGVLKVTSTTAGVVVIETAPACCPRPRRQSWLHLGCIRLQLCDLGRVFYSSLVFLMRSGVAGL